MFVYGARHLDRFHCWGLFSENVISVAHVDCVSAIYRHGSEMDIL